MLTQQPIELVFDHLVTLANCRFQLLAIEDLDVTADVTDRPGILQSARSHGHAFAAHPQHAGNQFLSHDQFVSLHAVVAEQQPAAKLLLNCVKTVANSRL